MRTMRNVEPTKRRTSLRVIGHRRIVAEESRSTDFKDVTHAANGVDQFLLEGIVDLGPQTADSHVDDVRIGLEPDVPHFLRQDGARENLSAPPGQEREEQKLFRSQRQ